VPRIILGIPGKWPTRADVVRAIAEFSGGYLFSGNALMNAKTEQSWPVDVYQHDPKLRRAFEVAGQGLIDDVTLDEIASHTQTIYVLGEDVGLEPARAMLDVGRALLDAGGLAVKVESCGTAHDAKTWRDLSGTSAVPTSLYRALVVLVGKGSRDVFYSCGMHHFGLPDTTVDASVGPEEAATAMNRFNVYQMTDSPALQTGHTFSVAADAPRYRLERRACAQFPAGDPFHNPDGYWHLTPV
jgi:hypothetical protein